MMEFFKGLYSDGLTFKPNHLPFRYSSYFRHLGDFGAMRLSYRRRLACSSQCNRWFGWLEIVLTDVSSGLWTVFGTTTYRFSRRYA